MVGEQAVQQSARPIARRRVRDEPSGLVEHDEVFIFIQHHQRHRLRAKGQALFGGHQLKVQGLPDAHALGRGGGHHTIHLQVTFVDQLLQMAARELRCQVHQRLVHALAVLLGIDHRSARVDGGFGIRFGRVVGLQKRGGWLLILSALLTDWHDWQ